jgi:hypothetical protein
LLPIVSILKCFSSQSVQMDRISTPFPAYLCALVGFLCFVMIVPAVLVAQTEVQGDVSGVWTVEGSPYIVLDSLIILEGEQLTIEPGVEVRFEPQEEQLPTYFYNFGFLEAIGTEQDSIIFTSNADEPWPWDWGRIWVFGGGVSMSYVSLSYMGNGIEFERDCSPVEITHCRFAEYGYRNRPGVPGGMLRPHGNGIRCEEQHQNVTITDCIFTNGYSSRSEGIRIEYFENPEIIISNCQVQNVNNYGICASLHDPDDLEGRRVSITDCEVMNCGKGISASIRNGELIIDNCTIRDCAEWGIAAFIRNGELIIDNCTVSDCEENGVSLGTYNSQLRFTNNDVFNTVEEAVYLSGSGDDENSEIIIRNNRLHHCRGGFWTNRFNNDGNNTTLDFSFNTIAYSSNWPLYMLHRIRNNITNNIFAFNRLDDLYARDFAQGEYNLYWNRRETDYGVFRWQRLAFPADLDLFFDPQFVSEYDLHLSEDSPAIDRGNPDAVYDREPEPNGRRVNIGGYANTAEATVSSDEPMGAMLRAFPHILLFNLGWFGLQDSIKVIFQNFGDESISIESIEISNSENFSINELQPFELEAGQRYADTLMVTFDPQIEAVFREQITITTDSGELIIPIEARSIPRPWIFQDMAGILTRENSPYVATPIRVRENDTLIIEPGVEIQFLKDRGEFQCDGTLIARGTEQDSIKFTSFELESQDRYWQGIECTGSVFLDYVVVEAVDTSSCLKITPEQVEDSVIVTNSSFRDSRSTGLSIGHTGYVEAHHNVASNCDLGIGIWRITEQSYPNIHHLTSIHNQHGISITWDSMDVHLYPENCISAFNEVGFSYLNSDDEKIIPYCGVFGNEHDGNVRFEDCIFEDPLFIGSPHYPVWLSEDSPGRNVGNPDTDPDPDGTRTDLGAIPFNHDAIEPEIDMLFPEDVVFECVTGVPIVFRVFGEDLENRILDYRWTIDDSSFWGGDSLIWEFAESGNYIISVNATNGYFWAMEVVWGVSVDQNSISREDMKLPIEFTILSMYPNPFNPSTTVAYSIPHPGNLSINLYDLQGRNISQEVLSIFQTGRFSKVFDLSDYPTGVYFVEMEFESVVKRQKLVLIR